MNSQPSREAAARILGTRRSIRGSLAEWARYKGFEPARHHLLIIDEIEAFLADPDAQVLLLHAPPGSAKSTYLSILLPAWYLANNPAKNVIAATHSVEFAQRWGRRVRNIVMDDGPMLGLRINPQNIASDRWALLTGGEYYGVGAGVGIAGFRADLAIADDLFGNREDAWSDTVRQKRWDWYQDDWSNRMKPHCKRLLMNTRWHEEDVAGRVIQQIERGEVTGKVIDIRAIAEEADVLGRPVGAWLWDEPKGYDYAKYLRGRKKEVTPMMWAALFQQRPAPEEGDFFKVEWLRFYDKPPARETLRVFGASDYAMTAEGGDYTVHVVAGIDADDRIWLLDVWRKQADPKEWVEAFCDLVLQWRPLSWAEENVQITSGIGPYLESRQRARRAWCAREVFATRGDKAFRAQSIRGRMALTGLYVPMHAEWFMPLRRELLGFPAAKHDDQVDALGLLGQLLDLMFPPPRPEEDRPKPEKLDWFEEREDDRPNWKVL